LFKHAIMCAMKQPNGQHNHDDMPSLDIRSYTIIDYPRVKELYELAGVFDPETDAEDRLLVTVEENPDSILVATDEDGTLLGTISIIQDNRIAILFRLVAKPGPTEHLIRMRMLHDAEQRLREYGFHEVHILAHEEDSKTHEEYTHYGFTKGKLYRWFWKKIEAPKQE
jgi:hypothetical protein